MGADLYIEKLRRPVKAEWQPKFDAAVSLRNAATDEIAKSAAQKLINEAYDHLHADEHYFRDSYNATSVLQRLGLSWWRDLEPDVHDEDADINVSPEACRVFLEKIQSAEFVPITRAELESRHATVDDDENSAEVWNKYFSEKRDRLVAFLKRAIENGGMYASC